MDNRLIALLGRKEFPTDGVEDYCQYLSAALARRGVEMKTVRVDWVHLGWAAALRRLRSQSTDWRGSWVIVHYTALSWSRRGFPRRLLRVLRVLSRSGVRCAVLFHESTRQLSGSRLRDRVRGAVQEWVIRRCFRGAERAIFTVPLEAIRWLPQDQSKAAYIPIGSNIPERTWTHSRNGSNHDAPKTVAVFCLSSGVNRLTEIAELSYAAERVHESIGAVRFVVLGKGSAEAKSEIERAFAENGVEISVLGRLPANQVADTLAASDVQLYLGGCVTQTRGSALAGVACGLPIVGYAGAAREPIHEAGVELVSYRDRQLLATALVRVLKDDALRSELRRKSSAAFESHFSWDMIGSSFVRALKSDQKRA